MDGQEEEGKVGSEGISLESDSVGSAAWEVSKLLLDAHSRSGRAMERYLLLQHLEREEKTDELQTVIEQAIADHERIIEELETALDTIERRTD